MADEITILLSLRCLNGTFLEEYKPGVKTFDQGTNPGSDSGTASLSTVSTDLSLGSVANRQGWAILKNLSTAEPILVGPTSGNPWLRIPPEGANLVSLVGNANINARTTSNTANLFYVVLSS